MPGVSRGKYGTKYSNDDMRNAVSCVLEKGWTAYKASKVHHVPYMTLQDRLKVTPSLNEMPNMKKGRPFCLSVQEEIKLVNYVVKMQEPGFGLTATEVGKEAYKLSTLNICLNRKNSFNPDKGIAGWDWWIGLKRDMDFAMRQPENISIYRAVASTRENIGGFYDCLEQALEQTGLRNNPIDIH